MRLDDFLSTGVNVAYPCQAMRRGADSAKHAPLPGNKMAKGQQRSTKEKKKPKKDKSVTKTVTSPFDRATPPPQKK